MTTGYEPRISIHHQNKKQRHWRLSPRNLVHMLNILPDNAIGLEAIEAALQSKDFLVRSSAAKRLVDRNDRDARLVLQRVLLEGDGPARANIARHLFGLSWFSAQPLFEKTFADEDYRVREGVVYSLCKIATLEAYQLLIDHLQHETHDQVLGAPAMEWGVYRLQDPLAIEVLKLSLKATDPEIRAKAMETFSTTETKAAVAPVRATMLADNDDFVIYSAALSYVELMGIECVADFAQLFASIEDAKRLTAMLRGFFHATNYRHIDLAQSDSIDALIDALMHVMHYPDERVRRQAIWCLAWTKHPRIPAIIHNFYHAEADSMTKALILNVAVNLMVETSQDLLELALESDDVEVLKEARQLKSNFQRGNS